MNMTPNDPLNQGINDTEAKLSKSVQKVRKIVRLVFIIILVIIGIKIGKSLIHLSKMGWSLRKNKKEIAINEPDYDSAMAYWADMDYQNAEAFMVKALAESDAKNGTGSEESAAISQKLGALYLEEGKYGNAYDCLNSAYVTFKEKLGEKDGNTVIARGQMARYDIDIGNYEQGFATLDELYDTTTYIGYKMQILQTLAWCHAELGHYKWALDLYDRLGEYYTQFGIYNLGRVNLVNDYGILMMKVGNYPQALDALKGAVSVWEGLNLKEDSTIGSVYSNLAHAYVYNLQPELADEAGKKAIAIQKAIYGENNINVALSYAELSQVFAATDDTKTEEDYLKKALETAIESVGENHMATAVIYLDIGEYYMSVEELQKALDNYGKALEIRKNLLGINNPNTIAIYEELSEAHRLAKHYEEGISDAENAIRISEEQFGRENVSSAHCYITAAWVYSDSGDHEKAKALAETALGIYNRQKDNAGINLAYAYQTVGYTALNASDYQTAIDYLGYALNLYQTLEGDNRLNTANTMAFLGKAYFKAELYDESFSTLSEAYDIAIVVDKSRRAVNMINSLFDGLYKKSGSEKSYDDWLSERRGKKPSNGEGE